MTLMRVSRIFNATNWKYAIGEVLLIVVGVSIALGANSWYENQQERNNELQVLRQLKQALEVDLAEFESRYNRETEVLESVSIIIEHMQSDAGFDSELLPRFISVLTWVGVRTNSAPYEALKSRGFALISSDSLQLALIYYYENQVPSVLNAYLNDRAWVTDRAVPFYMENFRIAEQGIYVPDDFQSLMTDKYFWNLCMTKQNRLQNRVLPYYEQSIDMIHDILGEIDAALDN